jgi:UDP-N-acetylmuramate-alanine ligase
MKADGSIAMFSPKIAVLNNISLDHKSMDELRVLFRDFVGKANAAVLNLDNDETAALKSVTKSVTYSLGIGEPISLRRVSSRSRMELRSSCTSAARARASRRGFRFQATTTWRMRWRRLRRRANAASR